MIDLAGAASLLDDVRTLAEGRMHRDRMAAQEAVARLRDDWTTIKRRRRSHALNHNLIRFLGYERSEVAFHSPFLCDLLDPNGTHDQGTLFLGSFLQILADRARACAVNWTYEWQEPNELEADSWLVLPERGKIDISIRNKSDGVLIFIETKIDAPETEGQLCRYAARLNKETTYPHRLLVFIAPKGYRPQTGKPDVSLTYEKDIASWIEGVEDKLPDTAVSLRGNLQQYRLVIRALDGVGVMASQDLIDLIIKPENIPWALEIEAAMLDAKTQLLRGFWRAVKQALRDLLADLNLTTEFRVEGFKQFEGNPGTKYDGVFLIENAISSDRAHLQLGIFHDEQDEVCPGLKISRLQQDPGSLTEISTLAQALPEHWRRDPSDWWVGYEHTGYTLESHEFLRKLAQDPYAVAASMTQDLAVILRDQIDRIRSADRALQAAPS
jgi:hypothetical protein